jgi:hypothetical protein
MLQQMFYQKATMPPPVNVGGYNPADVWYMNYHGNQLREEARRTAMMNAPDIQQIESTLEGTKYSGLVDQLRSSGYAGSALQEQLLSHQASQILLGGNVSLGAGQLLNAACFATRTGVPVNNMTELSKRHEAALAMTSGMNQYYMDRIYEGNIAPNMEYLRGFKAEAPMQIAAQMMARGNLFAPGSEVGRFRPGEHYTIEDGQYRFTQAGVDRARNVADRVEPIMDMLSSGRQVFGDRSATQMLAATDRFFGTDSTGYGVSRDASGRIQSVQAKSVDLRGRLQEIAALARSVNMDAEELVQVKEKIQGAITAVSGYGASQSTMAARSIAAMDTYARTVNLMEGDKGGPLSQRQKDEVMRSAVEFQGMTAKSSLAGGARIMNLMAATGQVDKTTMSQYEAAVERGDRFGMQKALRRVSAEQFGDENTLMRALQNEAATTLMERQLTETIQASAGGESRMQEAQREAGRDIALMAASEREERMNISRGQRISRIATSRARRGGVTLNTRAADAAAVGAMVEAAGTGDFLAGVSGDDRSAIVRQMKLWQEAGMSSGQMMQAMSRSELFQMAGVDPGRFQSVVAGARGQNLAEQLETRGGDVAFGREVSYVMGAAGPRNQQAREARRKIQQLRRAGKMDEAKAELDKFIESNFDPKMRGDIANMRKRITADERSKIENLKSGKILDDPTQAAKFGTAPTQRMIEDQAVAIAEGGDLDAAIDSQKAEGEIIEAATNTAQPGGIGALREGAKAYPGKPGFWSRLGSNMLSSGGDPSGIVMALGKTILGDSETKVETERKLAQDKADGPIEVIIVESRLGSGGYRAKPAAQPRSRP